MPHLPLLRIIVPSLMLSSLHCGANRGTSFLLPWGSIRGVGPSLSWINRCLSSPWRAAVHCGEDAALEQRSKGGDGDRMLIGSGLLVPLLPKFPSRIGSSVGTAAWGGREPDVGNRRMVSHVGASSNGLKS